MSSPPVSTSGPGGPGPSEAARSPLGPSAAVIGALLLGVGATQGVTAGAGVWGIVALEVVVVALGAALAWRGPHTMDGRSLSVGIVAALTALVVSVGRVFPVGTEAFAILGGVAALAVPFAQMARDPAGWLAVLVAFDLAAAVFCRATWAPGPYALEARIVALLGLQAAMVAGWEAFGSEHRLGARVLTALGAMVALPVSAWALFRPEESGVAAATLGVGIGAIGAGLVALYGRERDPWIGALGGISVGLLAVIGLAGRVMAAGAPAGLALGVAGAVAVAATAAAVGRFGAAWDAELSRTAALAGAWIGGLTLGAGLGLAVVPGPALFVAGLGLFVVAMASRAVPWRYNGALGLFAALACRAPLFFALPVWSDHWATCAAVLGAVELALLLTVEDGAHRAMATALVALWVAEVGVELWPELEGIRGVVGATAALMAPWALTQADRGHRWGDAVALGLMAYAGYASLEPSVYTGIGMLWAGTALVVTARSEGPAKRAAALTAVLLGATVMGAPAWCLAAGLWPWAKRRGDRLLGGLAVTLALAGLAHTLATALVTAGLAAGLGLFAVWAGEDE